MGGEYVKQVNQNLTMRVTILGSGTNLHPRRAAAGYMITTDRPIVLDFGPRTLSNLLKTDVDRYTIQHLLFTHYHADHFSDFLTFYFDAVCQKYWGGTRGPLHIYGPPGTKRLFETLLATIPVFADAAFRVHLKEVHRRPFRIGDTTVAPLPMTHSDSQVCLGYRINFRGKTIAFSGDAMASPNLVKLCRKAHVAILDCSFSSQRPGVSHMHAEECGKVASEAGVKTLVLSHFYQEADRSNVVKQARKHFSRKIIKAKDLMTLRA